MDKEFFLQQLAAGFETEKFPVELCTVNSKTEPNTVFESKQAFLCLVLNPSWEQATLKVLFPYKALNTFPDENTPSNIEWLFGWTDESDNIVDHCENSVHYDDEYVIAWKLLQN